MTKKAGISIFGLALAIIFWSFTGPSTAQKSQAPSGASNKGFTAGQDNGGNGRNGGKGGKEIPSNKDIPSDKDVPEGKFPNKDGKLPAAPDENNGDNGANDADGDQGQQGIGKSQSQDDKRSGPVPDEDLPDKKGSGNGNSNGGEADQGEPDKGNPAPVPEKEPSDKDSLDTSLDENDRNIDAAKKVAMAINRRTIRRSLNLKIFAHRPRFHPE